MCAIRAIKDWAAVGLLSLCVMACAPQSSDHSPPPSTDSVVDSAAPFSLGLSQQADGTFELFIDLYEPQEALFFSYSNHDYRRGTYESVSDGVRLERIDGFDTLLFDPGVMQGRFRIAPFTEPLAGTYTAFVPFSDGGMAVSLTSFELLQAESADTVAALGGDITAWSGQQFDIPLRLRSQGQVLINGVVAPGEINTKIERVGSYAYLGPTAPIEGDSFAGIIDPGLPEWLSERFDAELGLVFEALETRFGRQLQSKASVFLAFRGYEPEGYSSNGGVSGGQMMLEMSGSVFRTPNDRLKGYIQWFLTHEAAHLFQNSLRTVGYSNRSSSWLVEGSANAITHIVLSDLGTVPQSVIQSRYQRSYDICVNAIKGVSMGDITQRNDQSHYDCGDMLWRIADAALPNHDVFILWDKLAAQAYANAGQQIAVYGDAEFYTVLLEAGLSAPLVQQMREFVDGPNPDPAHALQSMMRASGIKAEFDDGTLTSIKFPE